jgi:hypothetical protein
MSHKTTRGGLVVMGAVALIFLGAASAAAQDTVDCSDFDTQEEAQQFFEQHGGPQQDPNHLDEDGDGRACEGLPSAAGGSATPTATPGATATPVPTATPTGQALPKNGAGTVAMALSGLTFLEAGYGLTLLAKRVGVRSRSLPLHLMRRLVRAAERGQEAVELTDDLYLVRRAPQWTVQQTAPAPIERPVVEPLAPEPQPEPALRADEGIPAGGVYAALARADTGELPIARPRSALDEEFVFAEDFWEDEPEDPSVWPFFTPPTR